MREKILSLLVLIAPLMSWSQVNIVASDSSGCTPLATQFSSTQSGVYYHWDFGNGLSSTQANPSIVYLTPGNYDVTLTLVIASGDTLTSVASGFIQAYTPPVSSFSIQQTGHCTNFNQLDFSNNSQNGNIYSWNFGDGGSSSDFEPTYTYADNGSFIVKLFVTNSQGCTAVSSDTIPQAIQPVPTTSVSISDSIHCDSSHLFGFSYTGTGDSILWNFGDNSFSSSPNILHAYNAYGSYTPQLIAQNSSGCADSLFLSPIIIQTSPYIQITGNTEICSGDSLMLSANSTGWEYTWLINNDSVGTGESFNYLPDSSASLTMISSLYSCRDTIEKNVTVNELPEVNIFSSDTLVCGGSSVDLWHNMSQNNMIWQYGNTTSTNDTLNISIQGSGSHLIYLQVTDSNACMNRDTISLYASRPGANFTFAQPLGCPPLFPDFTNVSQNAVSYLWDFGNGQISTDTNPNISYINEGIYDVTLIAFDSLGCSDTLSIASAVTVEDLSLNYSQAELTKCAPYTLNLSYTTTGSSFWSWDPGDGSPSVNTEVLNHTYTTPGTYIINLLTNNATGCQTSLDSLAVLTILGASPPDLNLETSCSPRGIYIVDSTQSGNYSWFLDNNILNTQSGSFVELPDSLTHFLHIAYTDSIGCSYQHTELVNSNKCDTLSLVEASAAGSPSNLGGNLYTDFNVLPTDTTSLCAPFLFTLDYSHFNSTAQFVTWNMGDGTSYQTPFLQHLYDQSGVYQISMVVNDSGKMDTLWYKSILNVISFSDSVDYDLSPTCDGLQVSYNGDSSSGNQYTWIPYTQDTIVTPAYDLLLTNDTTFYQTDFFIANQHGCLLFDQVLHLIDTIAPVVFTSEVNCLGDSLMFATNFSSDFEFLWDFGDSTTLELISGHHYYAEEDTFYINLSITDPFGCTKTYYGDTVIIHDVNNAILISQKDFCSDELVYLQAQDTSLHYKWYVNGQQINGNNSPTLQTSFGQAGEKIVTLVSSEYGCSDKTHDTLYIHKPIASFNADQQSLCFPAAVNFTNTSQNATDYIWYFGDNTSDTTEHPDHVFSDFFSSPVSLMVSDTFGCTDSISKPVLENYEAGISVNKQTICLGKSLQFTDQSQNAVQWIWDFGDGQTSNSQNPQHTYASSGVYDIGLISFSQDGCSDTIIILNYIEVQEVEALPALTVNNGLCAPFLASFSSLDPNASVYTWDFGDGTTASVEHPSHYYTDAGNYDITLIVENPFGCRDTGVLYNALELFSPDPLFNISSPSVCDNDSVHFINSSTSAQSYFWDFGDGSTSNDINPSHLYSSPGSYTVTLVAIDQHGCSSVLTKNNIAIITPNPVIDFALEDSLYCWNGALSLLNNSDSNLLFNWQYNQQTYNSFSPQITINDTGWQMISVEVTDSLACSSVKNDSFFVYAPVNPIISPLDPVCETRDSVVAHVSYSNGTWSSATVNIDQNGIIDIDSGSVGTHNISFITNNYCPESDSVILQVDAWHSADFNLPPYVCMDHADFDLSPLYNGIWQSSLSINNNIVDHTSWIAGNNYLTHIVTNGACVDTAEGNLIVSPLPVIDILRKPHVLCANQSLNLDIIISDTSAQQNWTFTNINNGTFLSSSTFNILLDVGNWQVAVSLTDTLGCLGYSDTIKLNVIDTLHPGNPQIIRSTVINDNAIYTEWELADSLDKIRQYLLFRVSDKGDSTFVSEVDKTSQSFTDLDVDVHSGYYDYYIMSDGYCNTDNTYSSGNSIYLEVDEEAWHANMFYWNPYKHWEEGVGKYILQKQNPDGTWETIKVVPGHQNSVDY